MDDSNKVRKTCRIILLCILIFYINSSLNLDVFKWIGEQLVVLVLWFNDESCSEHEWRKHCFLGLFGIAILFCNLYLVHVKQLLLLGKLVRHLVNVFHRVIFDSWYLDLLLDVNIIWIVSFHSLFIWRC